MVDKAGDIDPLDCRRSAERFSPDRVAAGYEQVYRTAVSAGGELSASPAA
jgi:hypothetical protein